MSIKLSLLICFLLAYATGCQRESGESPLAVDPYHSSKVYTETELNRLITVGMSFAEVTNTFGLPGSAVKIGEDTILLTYMFPFEAKPEHAPYLTGFGIDIKHGRVVRWSPVTGLTGKSTQGGGHQGLLGEQSFRVFVASGELTNLVNVVDSTGSGDASDLKASPDLQFKAKVFAGSSGKERSGEQTVILVVSEQDASNLRVLTENNFGKRLLVVCRDRAVAAPVISVPLASRQLMFTVKDQTVVSGIQGK